MTTIQARFLKKDKFNNSIFLVDSELESAGYKTAKRIHKKLSVFESNPIWIERDKGFATLRFKKLTTKHEQLATYDITFNCFNTKKGDRQYATMVASEVKFVKSKDHGVLIDTAQDADDEDSD
jgi:hypothetical protein